MTRRRNGLNLGDINTVQEDEDVHNNSADGNIAEDEDGRGSFGSNVCNKDGIYNAGSDLEDDLNNNV